MSLLSGAKSSKLKRVQSGFCPGDLEIRTGHREISSVSGRLLDNPEVLALMHISSFNILARILSLPHVSALLSNARMFDTELVRN